MAADLASIGYEGLLQLLAANPDLAASVEAARARQNNPIAPAPILADDNAGTPPPTAGVSQPAPPGRIPDVTERTRNCPRRGVVQAAISTAANRTAGDKSNPCTPSGTVPTSEWMTSTTSSLRLA